MGDSHYLELSHMPISAPITKSDWPDFITDPSALPYIVQELIMGEGGSPKKITRSYCQKEEEGVAASLKELLAVPFGELITRHLISCLGKLRPRERLGLA